MKDALACFERALALSPFDPFTFNIYFGMASASAELGDFAKAIELAERGLHSGPGVTWAYRMLASYYAQAGNQKKSAAALAELLRHNRSEEHTSELQSLMRISYAVFCLKKKKQYHDPNKDTAS